MGTWVVKAHGYAVLDGTVLVYEVWDPPLSFLRTRSDRSEGTLMEPGGYTSSISLLATWQHRLRASFGILDALHGDGSAVSSPYIRGPNGVRDRCCRMRCQASFIVNDEISVCQNYHSMRPGVLSLPGTPSTSSGST